MCMCIYIRVSSFICARAQRLNTDITQDLFPVNGKSIAKQNNWKDRRIARLLQPKGLFLLFSICSFKQPALLTCISSHTKHIGNHIKHIYIYTFFSTFSHTPMQLEFRFGKCTLINFISGMWFPIVRKAKRCTKVMRKHNIEEKSTRHIWFNVLGKVSNFRRNILKSQAHHKTQAPWNILLLFSCGGHHFKLIRFYFPTHRNNKPRVWAGLDPWSRLEDVWE